MCADAKIQNILPSCADIQAKIIKADKFVSKQAAAVRNEKLKMKNQIYGRNKRQ